MAWYDGLTCRVKWGDNYSSLFDITAGVRQGGVLSPDLYGIYVDGLISKLISLQKGCYMCRIFAAALFYADDMAILAPSIKGLQSLLNLCEAYCLEWDICLNAKETKKTSLNGREIEWVDQRNHLGITLKSGSRFAFFVNDRVKKNVSLHQRNPQNRWSLRRHCHATASRNPLRSNSHLRSGSDSCIERRRKETTESCVQLTIFRKLFGYRWSQSVTALQHFLDRPTWEELVEKRRNGFVSRVEKCDVLSLPRIIMP